MARERRKFKYRDSDPTVTSDHADRRGDFDRILEDHVKVFTAKEGKNRIRIMPRTWEDDQGPKHWAFPLYMHYGVGPDNSRYPCPNRNGWGPCPMCEERSKLDVDGDKDAASELRPSPSQLCWIIDRNREEDGPQVFLMPSTKLEGPICDLSRDPDTGERLKIEHPESGYDITFTRKGTGRNTDYSAAAVARKATFLSEDEKEEDEWLTFIEENPLPKMVKRYEYDYLKQVFGGLVSSRRDKAETEEIEEEVIPRSRRRGQTADAEEVRKPIDDDDQELDEPEEEEAPRRREKSESGPRSTRRSSPGDTEEAEAEVEEAEEEPKPSRRSKLHGEVKRGLRRRSEL